MITMWNVRLIAFGIVFFIFNQSTYAKELAGEVVSVSGIAFIRQDGEKELPKTPARVKPGDNIYSGDVLNTSSEGSVKILMRDKSVVDLGASSLFKVDEYQHNKGNDRKAKLDLMFGKVRIAVTKKIEGEGSFKVKTHSATMGVRGTEFIVSEAMPDKLSKNDKNNDGGDKGGDKGGKDSKAPATQQTQVTVVQGKVEVAAQPVPVMKANGSMAMAPTPKVIPLTAGMQITTTGPVAGGAAAPALAPVKLDATQMQTLSASSKLSDNTFKMAVTIEPVASGGGSSNSGGDRSPSSTNGSSGSAGIPSALGNVIAAAVGTGTSANLPTIDPKTIVNILSNPVAPPPPPTVSPGTPVHLHVNITTASNT